MRIAATILAGMFLVACAGPNSSLNTLQFSGDVFPFPANYQLAAARVVRERGGDPSSVLVSYPRQTIGLTMTSPQRWYVCLRGMPGPSFDRMPMAADVAAQWMFQQHPKNRYDVVLVFSRESSRPSLSAGRDSPLCNDGAFEPLAIQ